MFYKLVLLNNVGSFRQRLALACHPSHVEFLDNSLELPGWDAELQHLSRLPNPLGLQKYSYRAKDGCGTASEGGYQNLNKVNNDSHKVNAHAAGSQCIPDTTI
jgi:hypothetical protein